MTVHVAVLTQNSVDGKWRAQWLTTRSDNGTEVTGYRDPAAALASLAGVLADEQSEKQRP